MGDRERISSWTKFKLPPSKPLELYIFKPLFPSKIGDFDSAFYGPTAESPGEYVLIAIWDTEAAYREFFTGSAHYGELLANLKADTPTEPATQLVDFERFPHPSETREAVDKLKGLVLTMAYGYDGTLPDRRPYNCVPLHGWVDGLQIWNGQETIACVWCHYWKNKAYEEAFKATERRWPKEEERHGSLTLEAFEQDLRPLGALGWEDIHVDFKEVPRMA